MRPREPDASWESPLSYTPPRLAQRILSSRAELEGERKHVTILFADVKDSMELVASRDPEEARGLLDPVLELRMEAVHRYEGIVNQVRGAGVMAIFGAPLASEDHAVRACYAALAMRDAIRRYGDQLAASRGLDVRVRVGMNSGEVVVRHRKRPAYGLLRHRAGDAPGGADGTAGGAGDDSIDGADVPPRRGLRPDATAGADRRQGAGRTGRGLRVAQRMAEAHPVAGSREPRPDANPRQRGGN